MLEAGLVNEVERLVEKGYAHSVTSMQGIGYKEILRYLRNEITLEEAIEIIKRDSRRYAKRKITWFKRINEIKWFSIDNSGNTNNIVEKVITYIRSHSMQLTGF